MPTPTNDLAVRGESIQRLYDLYVSDRFEVNRRYQRKLVWTVEEKQKLIDSIQRDLPLPLVLVAELSGASEGILELIDGLQRMNAIFSFLENEYSVNGSYFDLDTLADTKLLKDKGLLTQKIPVMDRDASSAIANYTVALSVFRAPDQASIEEVFRRINSGGRRLSRQSLRQAGTISPLADLVRVISSRIRTDTSPGNSVPLREMPKLSITNYSLDYGVKVDEIFWVQNLVLRREDIRESLDEQLILDLLIDCVIDPLQTSGTRTRDAFFNYTGSNDGPPTKESTQANIAIESYGAERITESFMRVYDELRATIEKAGKKFAHMVGAGNGGRSPRYYHGVFIALYELLVREHLRIRDYSALAEALDGIAASALAVPGGGGDWPGSAKRSTINGVKGVIRDAFEGPVEGEDLGRFSFSSHLETILNNSLVEQQLFDHKQGFLELHGNRDLGETSFHRIACTLTAMHNMGPGSTGYVVIGIADKLQDVRRIETLDGVIAKSYRGFEVVGLEREAKVRGKTLNDYWHWLVQKLQSAGLDVALGQSIAADARLVPYHDLAVGILQVKAGTAPLFVSDSLYERRGSDTVMVPRDQYMRVFSRFSS